VGRLGIREVALQCSQPRVRHQARGAADQRQRLSIVPRLPSCMIGWATEIARRQACTRIAHEMLGAVHCAACFAKLGDQTRHCVRSKVAAPQALALSSAKPIESWARLLVRTLRFRECQRTVTKRVQVRPENRTRAEGVSHSTSQGQATPQSRRGCWLFQSQSLRRSWAG
jgi:hypothetical protein